MMRAGGFCLTLVRDVAPLSLSPSWERSSLFSPRRVGKTENREQRNNCTKYSPAVAMATGPGASPTSATLFRFALDPEKRRFGFLSVKLSGAGEIGRKWRERGAISNALHAGISKHTHTHTFEARPAVLYRHLSETHQTSLQEPRGRAVIKVT